MSYVICKEPGTQIDLMVKKKYHAQLVSYFSLMGCTYKKEVERTIKGLNEDWVTLKDISAKNGQEIGNLLVLFFNNLDPNSEDKFYVLIHKVRGKKHYGGKNRKKADPGSEGRTAEGPAEADRHDEHDRSDRGVPDAGPADGHDIRSDEAPEAAGNCDCE